MTALGVHIRSSIAGAVLAGFVAGIACGESSVRRAHSDEAGAGVTDSTGGGTGGVAIGGGTTGGTAGDGTTSGGRGSQTGGSSSSDPYPRVEWEGGNGYMESCPAFPTSHGFLCWHFDGVASELCQDPLTCNACLCSVPCDRPGGVPECPRGLAGTARPACVHETPTTVGQCMLECDSASCPDGMTCTPYPELSISVCMWLAESG
jgi:hypothetical protein